MKFGKSAIASRQSLPADFYRFGVCRVFGSNCGIIKHYVGGVYILVYMDITILKDS
ncbi:MAG: hypothetical protein ACR2LR_16170 [Hassallia sp.]